jgi:hypothetical protein
MLMLYRPVPLRGLVRRAGFGSDVVSGRVIDFAHLAESLAFAAIAID